MKLNIGNKIRELRRRDGRTQENLAEALGVTAQAVSRWEAGGSYPDMEIIPSVAHYFGITIDELFGYENERETRIAALAERIDSLNAENNGEDISMDACLALARNALIEFPGNVRLLQCLASTLYNAGYVRRGECHRVDAEGYNVYDVQTHRTYPEWQEAIVMYEKLLPLLEDGDMRRRAVREVMQLYLNTGEQEKALALAESAPDVQNCCEFLRIRAFDGREHVQAAWDALLSTLRAGAELLVDIVLSSGNQMSSAQKLQHLHSAVLLFDHAGTESLAEHRAFLAKVHMLRSLYLWLDGRKDEAFAALEISSALHPLSAQDWPWWHVPEEESVGAEMQADPRWAKWAEKSAE